VGCSIREPRRVAPPPPRREDFPSVRCGHRIERTLILLLSPSELETRFGVSTTWRVLFRRPSLLLGQPRPLVTCRRLSRPALSGPVAGGNENSDPVVVSSFPVRAVVAPEFLSRQIESWRCSWHDGVMEPDAASSDWCPRTTFGSEFGSRALSTCSSNVHFFGGGLKHPSETQSQRRYKKDDQESLAPLSRVGPDAMGGEEECVATAKVGECRSDAVTRSLLGVKTRATLTQRAVRALPTPSRLTVVNLAVLLLVP
jgi:hypothetical protein